MLNTPKKRSRGRQHTLSAEQMRLATVLRRQGLTYRQVGEHMGVPYVTAYRACVALEEALAALRAIPVREGQRPRLLGSPEALKRALPGG